MGPSKPSLNGTAQQPPQAPPAQAGVLVAQALEDAIGACRRTVAAISNEHRLKNKKFRDTEFDLEHDTFRCLHGYTEWLDCDTRDVQRVTDLFSRPRFFPEKGAAASTGVRQGMLGDCYFLSALATASSVPGLVEKICVARDEQVGVYGFIFHQDGGWVSVIVDDLLMTNIPKWESLDANQKLLYHEDKDHYNETARTSGNILYYARGGEEDETWVPLIEKAYAKLYTNYSHLEGGVTHHSVEDLTGGVSVVYLTKDILDTGRFWSEELMLANKDRLFACGFYDADGPADDPWSEQPVVQGLLGGRSYSVLRAAEFNGRRFLVLRNPWGKSEWKGPWSNGSREWTDEWTRFLPQLQHSLQNSGQFVMEYADFLRTFDTLERTYLFDDSWVESSSWLHAPIPAAPHAASYGTLSFTATLPERAKTIFVLSKLNDQAFRSVTHAARVSMDYAVVRLGDAEPILTVTEARPYCYRSLALELELEAGTYVVYVRVDREKLTGDDVRSNQGAEGADGEDDQEVDNEDDEEGPTLNTSMKVISRIISAKMRRQTIAGNWEATLLEQFTPKTLSQAIAEDLRALAGAANGGAAHDEASETDESVLAEAAEAEDAADERFAQMRARKISVRSIRAPSLRAPSLFGDTTVVELDGGPDEAKAGAAKKRFSFELPPHTVPLVLTVLRLLVMGCLNLVALVGLGLMRSFIGAEIAQAPAVLADASAEDGWEEEEIKEDWRPLLKDKGTSVILGLRVFTQAAEPAEVTGRLKLTRALIRRLS